MRVALGEKMSLVKFEGNFIEVADKTLTRADTFYAPMDPQAFSHQLELDIERTCYADYQHSMQDIQRRLRSTEQLTGKVHSLSQGQITAALFTEIPTTEKRVKLMTCGDSNLVDQLSNEFCFTYLDNDGTVCGLSVAFMLPYYELSKNNQDQTASFPQGFATGRYPFSLSVVRNGVNTPSEIEVSFYAHPDMLCLDTLLNLAEDPLSMPFDRVRQLLKNQNGCILYQGRLFYVDIIEKTFKEMVAPSPEKEALINVIDALELNQARYTSSDEDTWIAAVTGIPLIPLKKVRFDPEHEMVDGLTEDALRELINNTELSDVLTGLISGDTLSIEHFNAFAARLHANHNIDDREVRKTNLEELLAVFKDIFPTWDGLEAYISDVREAAIHDVNFYRTDVFKEKLNQIVDKALALSPTIQVNAIRQLTLTRDAILMEMHVLEARHSTDEERLELTNTAKKYRVQTTFFKTLQDFEDKLKSKQNEPSKDIQKKFYKKGEDILDLISGTIIPELDSLSHHELLKLTEVLNVCTATLDNPAEKSHVEKLSELSKEVVGKEKPFWKKLGFALLIFTGFALMVAGILAFVPSVGSSSLGVAFGASAVTSGLAGFGFYSYGREKGVAKSLSDFKDDLILLQKDQGLEGTVVARPSSPTISESIDSVELSDAENESPRTAI